MCQKQSVTQVTNSSIFRPADFEQALRILRNRDSEDLLVALAARRLYCDWFMAQPDELRIAARDAYDAEKAA
jgi:hypothetical protein